jgi:HSP20 family protein
MASVPAPRSSSVLDNFGNFQRLIDRFFNQDVFANSRLGLANADWSPSVDVVSQNGSYLVNVDLPGVDPKDIDVKVENGVLTISGERHKQTSEEKEGQRITETSYGSFARAFTLPTGVTASDIKATTKNGVLQIEVPKGKEAQSESVKIAVDDNNNS